MRAWGGMGIARPTSIGGMNRWYFTCNLKRRAVMRTESESNQQDSHRSDQGEELVEKSSVQRRASRTRRNGCGVPPCTIHEICWRTNGQERSTFDDERTYGGERLVGEQGY